MKSSPLSHSFSKVVRSALFLIAGMALMIGFGTAMAQTATPPGGNVDPNFTSITVDYDTDGSLSNAITAKYYSATSGTGGVKGSVQYQTGGKTFWAGGFLGYYDGTSAYGLYTDKDARVNGNLYVEGATWLGEYIYALGSQIRLSAADVHIDDGDFHVQDGNLQVHNGNLQVVRGDLDVTQGSVTAESIGYFYSAQASTGSNPSKQVTASCNSGDYVISCSGYDSDSLNTPANSFAGAYPYGNGCIALRSENDGTYPLFVYAYCFSPDGE